MVSIGPYSESMNFRHMFDIPDLRGHLPHREPCPTSLTGIIQNHPDFSRFRYMLNLANLESTYNDPQANFTLFIPSDKALSYIDNGVFTNMDKGIARHIVKSSTLRRKITSAILADSPASWLHTNDPPNRLFVTNLNGRTYINNTINVIHKDMEATNGIIHVIDDLIWPDII